MSPDRTVLRNESLQWRNPPNDAVADRKQQGAPRCHSHAITPPPLAARPGADLLRCRRKKKERERETEQDRTRREESGADVSLGPGFRRGGCH